jgi:hypothetical protein
LLEIAQADVTPRVAREVDEHDVHCGQRIAIFTDPIVAVRFAW